MDVSVNCFSGRCVHSKKGEFGISGDAIFNLRRERSGMVLWYCEDSGRCCAGPAPAG